MQKLALISALLLFAAATARAVGSSYESRRKQLAGEAEAQRRKLGLDPQKLYAQYPTPEVTLDGEAQRVSCGDSATVRLKGKFIRGTAFLFNDDDVQVIEQKASERGWQAKVKIASTAVTRDVNVHAIVPVSGAEQSQRALQIRARYELELKFEDGWSAHFATAHAEESGLLAGDLVWKKGGDTRTTAAQIDFSEGKLRFQWQRSEEEVAAQSAAAEKLQSLGGEEAMQKVMARAQACLEKAEPARTPCLESAQKQSDAEMEVMKKKMDAAIAEGEAQKPAAAWGCSEAQVEAAGGALSGVATCSRDRRLKISGTLKCLGPVSGE